MTQPGWNTTQCMDCKVTYYSGTTVRITNLEDKPVLCYRCARFRVFTREMQSFTDWPRCRACQNYPQMPGEDICHVCHDPTLVKYFDDYQGQRWWWQHIVTSERADSGQPVGINKVPNAYVYSTIGEHTLPSDLERAVSWPTWVTEGKDGHDLMKYSVLDTIDLR